MTRRETPNDIRSQKLQRRKNKLVVSRRNFTRFGTYQNEPSCLYTYQFVNWSNFVFVSESEQLFIFIFFSAIRSSILETYATDHFCSEQFIFKIYGNTYAFYPTYSTLNFQISFFPSHNF